MCRRMVRCRFLLLVCAYLLFAQYGRGQTVSAFEPVVPVQQLRVPAAAITELAKADRAYTKGDLPAARRQVERVVNKNPFFARALVLRGIINADEQKLDESCADLEKAIEYEPTLFGAYVALGRTYNNMGRWKDAGRVVGYALTLQPNSWPAEYELARSEAGQQRFTSALEHLVRVQRFSPQDSHEPEMLKAYILQRMATENSERSQSAPATLSRSH